MQTQVLWRCLRMLGVVAVVATAVACGSSSTPTTSPNPSPSADVMVTITGMNGSNSYSPNPATVKVGQTVAWHNADAIAHTATGSGFDTGSIAPGATSSAIMMNSAGSLPYHCSFHPSMVGTLNVTQ